MNGAEGGGPDVLAPMRGDVRLPGNEGRDILVANLVRRERENENAKAAGHQKHTLRPSIPCHSDAHATLGHDATNTVAD